MRSQETVEDLRDFWRDNLSNNYKLQGEIQVEKERLKIALPSRKDLDREISAILKLSTRKDMRRHFIQMKQQMKRHTSVRSAFEMRLKEISN